jgi:hypothetical protein
MNPLVFMILTSERDMKAQLEKRKLKEEEGKGDEPAPQPQQKTNKQVILRQHKQKSCECSY